MDRQKTVEMSEYFLEPKSSEGKVKVEFDLSNNPTKADLKIVTDVDASKFADKADLKNEKRKNEQLNNWKTYQLI